MNFKEVKAILKREFGTCSEADFDGIAAEITGADPSPVVRGKVEKLTRLKRHLPRCVINCGSETCRACNLKWAVAELERMQEHLIEATQVIREHDYAAPALRRPAADIASSLNEIAVCIERAWGEGFRYHS